MRPGSKTVGFLLSPFVLALFPTLIVVFFLPSMTSEYRLQLNTSGNSSNRVIYSDLNSDGKSEIINKGNYSIYVYVSVNNMQGRYVDQWNIAGNSDDDISGLFTGNYDSDSFEEIYLFTYRSDSLFLNVNEFLEPAGLKKADIYICRIPVKDNVAFSMVAPAGFFDSNGDSLKELFFVVSSGYLSNQPRKHLSVDITSGDLTSTPFTGNVITSPLLEDIDGDNKPELFGGMSASGNYKADIPFSDSSNWLMVFDDRLKFKFPPHEFRGFANSLWVNSYHGATGFRGILALHLLGNLDTSLKESCLMIYSPDGKLVRERKISGYEDSPVSRLYVSRTGKTDRIYIRSNVFTEYNEQLEPVRKVLIPLDDIAVSYQVDVDGNGVREFLVYSENQRRLLVYTDDLELAGSLELGISLARQWRFSVMKSDDAISRLLIDTTEGLFVLAMNRNRFYFLSYLVIPLIYILFSGFIYLIKKITTSQIEERENLKRQLLTLQLKSIKSQLDPHFTFNALNSVASLVYMEDRHTAYDYLNKFTKLIRRLLNDADKIYRSLDEELEFVSTYLELEKLRFGDRFNYSIKIGEGVTTMEKVPKYVLQTFAENAVNHGIMPLGGAGGLLISVEKESEYLIITIEDNGIGRSRAAGSSTSTGKGLKLADEFYDILNKVTRKQIKHRIIDLFDQSGNPSGTRIEIMVPVEE
jgi:hypothetical protein